MSNNLVLGMEDVAGLLLAIQWLQKQIDALQQQVDRLNHRTAGMIRLGPS